MNHALAWDEEHRRRLMFDQPLKAVKEFFADFDDPTAVKVLEVGCGAGSNAVWLANEGFQVHAFDSSPSAITRLLDMDLDRKVKSCVCDATGKFPYPDGMFDVVLDVRVLENLTLVELKKAHQEIVRVMDHGSWFVSVTASVYRDLTKTTCGKVRKTLKGDIVNWLKIAGLEVIEARNQFDGVHDLVVVAWKD